MKRWIATPEVAKHRIFAWMDPSMLPSGSVYAVARDDDMAFGVLNSKIHEVWALRLGTSLEDRPRYTSTTTFETFPFPEGLTLDRPAADTENDPRAIKIAEASRTLVARRDQWLNPDPWVEWKNESVPGYPRRAVPKPGFEDRLAERTLTSLYNDPEDWLVALHDDLDRAVAAAYGWDWPLTEDEILERLLALNAARQGK